MANGTLLGIVFEEAAEITEDQWRALTLDVIVNRHRRALREHAELIRAKQAMRWRFHQQWLDYGRYEGDSFVGYLERIMLQYGCSLLAPTGGT